MPKSVEHNLLVGYENNAGVKPANAGMKLTSGQTMMSR